MESPAAAIGAVTPPALATARSSVDPALATALEQLCPESRLVARYHLGWCDAAGNELMGSGGKALRPALALLSARAAGAGAEVGLPGAVAVELAHNSSIVHDDVIDRDSERRHRPAAWRVFGDARAVLTGDALLSLAWQVLLDSASPNRLGALRRLTSAWSELVAGQQADVSFEARLDVGVPECVAMAQAKTSALMSCSAAIGAELADGSPRLIEGLAKFGRHLGLAFQGIDDLLGTWGRPETTGKPVGSDLLQRKKNLPVAFALSRPGSAGAELRRVLSSRDPGQEAVAGAIEILDLCGARSWVNELVRCELDCGLDLLDALEMPKDVRADLREIAHFVAVRER